MITGSPIRFVNIFKRQKGVKTYLAKKSQKDHPTNFVLLRTQCITVTPVPVPMVTFISFERLSFGKKVTYKSFDSKTCNSMHTHVMTQTKF
jgi:hypothetical protein